MNSQEHFANLLRPLFRKGADFNHVAQFTGGHMYRVDWKTPEEGRPNKHSVPIELVITHEVVEDHQDAPRREDRDAIDRRIVSWVKEQLAHFDPKHNFPREQPVPAVRWTVVPAVATP